MRYFLKNKLLSILVILIFVSLNSFGKERKGYEIKVQINGIQNSDIYLGFHHGNKQFLTDTIRLNDEGRGTFRGDEKLEQGIYLIITPAKNYFELLIGEDQHFSLVTSKPDFMNTLKFEGAELNSEFLYYQRFMVEQNRKRRKLTQKLKKNKENEEVQKKIRSQIDSLGNQVKNMWDNLISEYEGTVLAVVIKAMKNPEVPDFNISDSVENKDSVRWMKRYQFYRDHYFDYIDLSDDRIVRTPILHNKVKNYFDNILIQKPDSIIPRIDWMIEQTNGNDETFKFLVQFMLNHFQKKNIMGMDEVFVHVAEKYYLSGRADWVDSATLSKLRDKVRKTKPNLIGNKAPNLKIPTSTGEFASLHDIESDFVILYFWEPNCGHCKTVTPKIWDIYKKYNRNQLEVFAFYTQNNKQEWLEYINKHEFDWINVYDPHYISNFRQKYDIYSTPTIYLLDKNKEIVAKRISYKSLGEFLKRKIGN